VTDAEADARSERGLSLPLLVSNAHPRALSQRLALRGKGDSSVGSICNFLASTRAATVSSSARIGGLSSARATCSRQHEAGHSDSTNPSEHGHDRDRETAPVRLKRRRFPGLGRDRSGACSFVVSASAPSYGRARQSGAPNARLWRISRLRRDRSLGPGFSSVRASRARGGRVACRSG
jgi:hypothetical protein